MQFKYYTHFSVLNFFLNTDKYAKGSYFTIIITRLICPSFEQNEIFLDLIKTACADLEIPPLDPSLDC